jgi:3-dehydroquinate synthase
LGLGNISHGEAVAWGIARSCDLGLALGITEKESRGHIINLLESFGYETRSPYPGLEDIDSFMNALMNDKKKKNGRLTFIVPNISGAQTVSSNAITNDLLRTIINHD